MKLADMIVSGLIKRGIMYEARNVETEVKIPLDPEEGKPEKNAIITLKIDHMSIKIEKE